MTRPERRHLPGRLSGLLPALLLLAACSNFHVVEPGRFYRSAQVNRYQLEQWIDRYHLKTVVSLRGGSPDNPDLVASRTAAENKGIRFVQHKLRARRYPTKPELLGLWKIITESEYPMLVHCQSGVDRSGLASGVYMLWRTNDLGQAEDQLDFIPYWHTGWFGSYKLDRVFEMYRPFHGKLSFPEWVEKEYHNPDIPDQQEHEQPGLHPRPAA